MSQKLRMGQYHGLETPELRVPTPMAPEDQQDQDELLFSSDKSFLVHGETMMFVVVLLFAVFLFFLLLCIYVKRTRTPHHGDDHTLPMICPAAPMIKGLKHGKPAPFRDSKDLYLEYEFRKGSLK